MSRRKLTVDIEGNPSGAIRAFNRTSKASKHLERDLTRGTRGIIAATGALGGLTRALALGSLSFVAGAGLTAGIKSVVEAAIHAEEVTAQTASAAEAAGLSWEKYGEQVEGVTSKLSKMTGFARTELMQSFQGFLRSTKNVNKALTLNALATNVARGSHKKLADAARLVQKASIGQGGALRRLGLNIEKGASAQKILTFLQKRFAGAASAYAHTAQGAIDRFHASMESMKESLGSGLLPLMTLYLNKAADWLGNSKNQAMMVRKLRETIEGFGKALMAIISFAKPVINALKWIINMVGGIKNAVILAAGAFLGFKVVAVTSALVVSTANLLAAGVVKKAWQAALISTGWGALAVAAGMAATYIMTHWEQVKFYFNQFWLNFEIRVDQAMKHLIDAIGFVTDKLASFKIFGKSIIPGAGAVNDAVQGKSQQFGAEIARLQTEKFNAGYIRALKQAIAGKKGKDKTEADKMWDDYLSSLAGGAAVTGADTPKGAGGGKGSGGDPFMDSINRMISRAQDGTLKQQLAKLKIVALLLSSRIASIKDIAKKLEYEDKLMEVFRSIKSTRISIAQDFQDALQLGLEKAGITQNLRDDLKWMNKIIMSIKARIKLEGKTVALQRELFEARQHRRELRRGRRDAKQFDLLGLGPEGDSRSPTAKGLRKRLGAFSQAVKGTFLDTHKMRTMLAHMRKILSGGLGKVSEEVRNKIKEILDGFDQKLKEHGSGDRTKWRHLSTKKILAGLGLSPEDEAKIRARLAQVGPNGTVPPGTTGAFGGAGAMTIGTVNVYGVQNPREFENHMRKRARSRPSQRRGN